MRNLKFLLLLLLGEELGDIVRMIGDAAPGLGGLDHHLLGVDLLRNEGLLLLGELLGDILCLVGDAEPAWGVLTTASSVSTFGGARISVAILSTKTFTISFSLRCRYSLSYFSRRSLSSRSTFSWDLKILMLL